MRRLFLYYLLAFSGLLLTSQAKHLIQSYGSWLGDWSLLAPIGHFGGFMLLTWFAFAARLPLPRWAIVAALAAFAVGTELLQGLVPARSPDPIDCLLNFAGIAMGIGLAWGIEKVSGSRHSRSEELRALLGLGRPQSNVSPRG